MSTHLPVLLARAGNGQNFSNSSSSSSSSHSSNSNSSNYIAYSDGGGYHSGSSGSSGGGAFAVAFILVVLAVFFVFYLLARGKRKAANAGSGFTQQFNAPASFGSSIRTPGSFDPGAPPIAQQTQPQEQQNRIDFDAIKAHDPAFNEQEFLAQCNEAFFLVQQAWVTRMPQLSRAVMDDELWNVHRRQIQEYISLNKRNVLDGLTVGQQTVLSAGSANGYDTVVMRFMAASADYDVDDNGHRIRGNTDITQWSEDWVFHRADTSTTKADGGIRSSKCPNCGGPLDLGAEGTCKYCHAAVMTGAFDWVLTRIQQV